MNRRSFTCLCYFLAGLILGGRPLDAQTTNQIPVTIFGPNTFTRGIGKPTSQSLLFTVPSTVRGPFTITVINGNAEGRNRVSSGRISINDIQILAPSDFNPSVGVIKRTVALSPSNSLTVELASAPGASITISIGGFSTEAATPTLVQSVNTSSTGGNVVNMYTVRLPNATLSGNALVLAVEQKSGSGAVTVSDDKGNAYNLGTTHDDGVQTVSVFYALNVVPGAQTITLTFAGGGANYVAAAAAEFYNVATALALDGASGNGGFSTLINAGNLTTTEDHDLIFQYATQDSDGANIAWTQGSSPWALLAADYFDAQAAQYQVQTTYGTINPALTQNPSNPNSSNGFNSVAIALKAGTAGTAPTGMRVVHLGHNHVPQSPGSSLPLQFPSTGNLIVVSWIAVGGCNITGVVDGHSNAYYASGPAFGNGEAGDNQLFYSPSAVTATDLKGPTLTLNVPPSTACDGGSSNALLYDISGAAASPFDTIATASGLQTDPGNLSTVTIAPSTANGIIITQTAVTYFTLISVTPGNFLATEPTPDISTGGIDNNNGWALSYNSDTSPETFVYGTKSGAVYQWSSIAVAFKK